MSIKVCLSADTIGYPEGGGHLWAYLNWALGLRSLGCDVVWLEGVSLRTPLATLKANLFPLKDHLRPFGLSDSVALFSQSNELLPRELTDGCVDVEAAAEADLLINLRYATPANVVKRFKRSALVDIDPGLLQIWMSKGEINVAPHDIYFTTGETVGTSRALFPDAGLKWHYTPPCVALDWWPVAQVSNGAPFTTVSHWYADDWVEHDNAVYANDKRSGFVPYLTLPRQASTPLELTLCVGADEEDDIAALHQQGWRVRNAAEVASTPQNYQGYIQQSRGEFSCAKPSCVLLQNAWISDRTLCYLASGKPVVVQHTGLSKFLPDSAGMFRFRDFDDAVRSLEAAVTDYERQCTFARAVAAEHFDARKVVEHLLERALR